MCNLVLHIRGRMQAEGVKEYDGNREEVTDSGKNCITKANSHIACHAHAVPLPCCAAKGLECVFCI